MKAVNHTGKKFARLTVLERAGHVGRRVGWRCRCDCGTVLVVAADKLTSGHTRSCGCLLADKNRENRETHGHARKGDRSLTYKSYTNMLTRCENPNAVNYEKYGGSGISICARWRNGTANLSGFECFLIDMGERPGQEYSIDRIDRQRGYEPGNCRWVRGRTQVLNRSSTVTVDVNGYEVPLAVACDLAGVNYATAWARLKRGQPWNGAVT